MNAVPLASTGNPAVMVNRAELASCQRRVLILMVQQRKNPSKANKQAGLTEASGQL